MRKQFFLKGVGMKEKNLIEDNRRADYFSFLYYLHEKKVFHSESLAVLCQYLVGLESVNIE